MDNTHYEGDKVPRRITGILLIVVMVAAFTASAWAASSFGKGDFDMEDLMNFLTFMMGLLVILASGIWWVTKTAGRTQVNSDKIDAFKELVTTLMEGMQEQIVRYVDKTDRDVAAIRVETAEMFAAMREENQAVLDKVEKQSDRLYDFMQEHIK